MPDEQRLKDLVARIPAERCSAPRCDREAAAVTRRGDRDLFLCVSHATNAARRLPVFRLSEDGVGVEELAADRDAHSFWEAKWSADAFAPEWRIRDVPREIRQAVEERWFPPGGTTLDIGCGSGEIAAWLARQGYEVLGVDIAEAAIERATEVYGDVPGLRFEAGDIRDRAPRVGEFDCLLDRGCLNLVMNLEGGQQAPAYVRNVTASAKRGARFLLLYPSRQQARKERDLRVLLGPEFEILRVADTVFERHSGDASEAPQQGLALWMIRK